MLRPGDEWMGLPEAAEYLGMSARTLSRFAYADQLRAFKAGRTLRFRRSDVDAYIRSCRVNPGDLGHLYPQTD